MTPIIQHLSDLRQAMTRHGIDLYIQPGADPHLSEYVSERFKGRQYLTGFTGSAGTVVVTQDEALLFTDGRYFIQAEKELAGSGVQLMKLGMEGYPTLEDWVRQHATVGTTIGLDGRLYSHSEFLTLKSYFQGVAIRFVTDVDLLNEIWQDRPSFPGTPVYGHDLVYAGVAAKDKIAGIRRQMAEKGADSYMVSSLNDIAWLLNIRADDIAYTPVVYAYLLMTPTAVQLFIHGHQLNDTVKDQLEADGVTLKPYDTFYGALGGIHGATLLYDPTKVNALMVNIVKEDNKTMACPDLIYNTKVCISPEEKANWARAQIRDGVAMVRFLHWFDRHVGSGDLTEYDAEKQVIAFRAEQALFVEPSFRSIPAYGANGALMHYSTSTENSPRILPKGLFLLDSGGQYLDGTTDITRTMAAGPLTEEEIRDFTLVVKAHIRLNRLTFLKGVTGTNVDIIARQVMWANHMDYKSGTGHGIGYLLGVHEGPARIRKEPSDVVLRPGMVLTNEPGVYKEGKHGIRIENTLLVEERATNDTGVYLGFDVISWCPIDLRCIDKAMLDAPEKAWLNAYHATVYEKLSPFVTGDVLDWLTAATRSI